jgi:hypothetical protein
MLAMVPLDQVAIDFRDDSGPGEFTRPSGTLQEGREYSGKDDSLGGVQGAALRSPLFASGKSVIPVCRPVRVQAVSPCLAT